jgi:hypothetical protein
MYFFDIADYYGSLQTNSWYQTGYGAETGGCAQSPMPSDWLDYVGTANETRNAFLKALQEWFIASRAPGSAFVDGMTNIDYRPDSGCTPTYNEIWVNCMYDYADFSKYRSELYHTVPLHRYYYDFIKFSVPNSILLSGGTYSAYKTDLIVNHYGDYSTGTTSSTYSIWNPYTGNPSGITRTVNYGTSFETADFQIKVDNFETSMKKFMCSVKNMIAVIDGDTFDVVPFDSNNDFVPNNGENYYYVG